jgi:hypothetical protein
MVSPAEFQGVKDLLLNEPRDEVARAASNGYVQGYFSYEQASELLLMCGATEMKQTAKATGRVAFHWVLD